MGIKKNFIFLDTETSGIDLNCDFVIELACVRVSQDLDTFEVQKENIFHTYLNPDCSISEESQKVHGISKDFLKDKPKFAEIADSFLEFIGDDILIAHNAQFDINFLNKELERNKKPCLSNEVIDSLVTARKLYPGSQVGLDSLMRRFNMSRRGLHSALEDAIILSKVYASMCSPTQDQLFLNTDSESQLGTKYKLCNKLINQTKIES
jgi:DNA polymerase III subunit epsilon